MNLLEYMEFFISFLIHDYLDGLWLMGIAMVVFGWFFKKFLEKRWVHV